jgi:hypothetical protein
MRAGIIISLFMWVAIIYVVIDAIPQSNVYACSEVNKRDPVDVQKLCKKTWRRYE